VLSPNQLIDKRFVFTEPKSANGRRTIVLPALLTLALSEYHRRENQSVEKAISSFWQSNTGELCVLDLGAGDAHQLVPSL